MKNRMITFACLLLFTAGVTAQTEVTVGVMHGKDYGVTYMLPKTEIEVILYATKHTYQPGEFCRYADRYLRLKDVSATPHTYWTLDEIKTQVVGVPDSEQVYFVKLKDKTTAPLMELTQDGIVRSINLPYSGIREEVEQPEVETSAPRIDPRQYLTEEILLTTSNAKMAELVAKEIYNIRESKNALIRGEADYMPQDGAQMKLMLDNLNLQEKAMMQMFTGTELTETKTFTLRVNPCEMHQNILARFSRKLGLLAKNDLAGEPVYISIHDTKTVTQPTEEEKEKAKKLEGVAYRVPGKARVTLIYQRQKMFDEEVPVSQFGSLEYLAPVLFNKNSVTKVLFDTATGGLLKVEKGE